MTIDKNSFAYTMHFEMTKKQSAALETMIENSDAFVRCLKAAKTFIGSTFVTMKPKNNFRLLKDFLKMGASKYYETCVTGSMDAAGLSLGEEYHCNYCDKRHEGMCQSDIPCHYCGAKEWHFNDDRTTSCCQSY